jgi:hypothetical protein
VFCSGGLFLNAFKRLEADFDRIVGFLCFGKILYFFFALSTKSYFSF